MIMIMIMIMIIIMMMMMMMIIISSQGYLPTGYSLVPGDLPSP